MEQAWTAPLTKTVCCLQEMLLALAQAVANASAALVLKAKNIASQCPDTATQNQVIGAAKDTAMTTSQLVACVKVVVPSINSHMCRDQVVEAAKLVSKAVDGTEQFCKVRWSCSAILFCFVSGRSPFLKRFFKKGDNCFLGRVPTINGKPGTLQSFSML